VFHPHPPLAPSPTPRPPARSVQFWVSSAHISAPLKGDPGAADPRLLPAECRERGVSYAGGLHATLSRRVNGGPVSEFPLRLGDVPIMVRSSRCHLAHMGPAELLGAGEEASEFGGYFICNGIERVIRLLQLPKRNYPMAITRGAYTNRGPLYSNKGVVIRCVRPDQSGITLTLHYLTDGSATVRFALRRQEFFLPVVMVLKALVPASDREIYERLCAGEGGSNTYLSDRVLLLLRDAKRYEGALHSVGSTRAFLGARFRAVLDMPPGLTDEQAGKALLDRYVLVHLGTDGSGCWDKFNLLVLMLRKLYGFVRGDVAEDNADSLSNQELLLSGHLLQAALKEKLAEYLAGIETSLRIQDDTAARAAARGSSSGGGAGGRGGPPQPVDAHDVGAWRRVLARQPDPGRRIYNLIATGNLTSSSGLDLMQASGFSVVADKINFMRFTTHFRAVHRGAFFAEMKTTTVRKLLPENWGFLCPVHTPDGAPCGLLNHLAAPCTIVSHPLDEGALDAAGVARSGADGTAGAAAAPRPLAARLTSLLISLGVDPAAAGGAVLPAAHVPVLLDGRLVGSAPPHAAYLVARALRTAKAVTGGVAGGLGDASSPGVAALLRAGALGLSTAAQGALVGPAGPLRRGGKPVAAAAAAQPEGVPPLPSADWAVPPSLEVAFVPPPWWDAETDPGAAEAGTGSAPAAAAAAAHALPAPTSGATGGGGSGALASAVADRAAADAAGVRASAASAKVTGLFPGLFLHSTAARLVRPVLQLDSGLVELIGPLEQLHLDIACVPEDVADILGRRPAAAGADAVDAAAPAGAIADGAATAAAGGSKKRRRDKAASLADDASSSASALVPSYGSAGGAGLAVASGSAPLPPSLLYRHIELFPHAMLSEVAALTPFSDLNQSPRNMYQCQMGKQTMG
jgi:hypothetical protein